LFFTTRTRSSEQILLWDLAISELPSLELAPPGWPPSMLYHRKTASTRYEYLKDVIEWEAFGRFPIFHLERRGLLAAFDITTTDAGRTYA